MPSGGANAPLVPYTQMQIASWNVGTRNTRDGMNPVEHYSPNGCGCTRTWLVNWLNRNDFIDYLVGDVAVWTDSGTGTKYLSRLMPQTHPNHSSWACTSAVCNGLRFIQDTNPDNDLGNLLPQWEYAEVEATYELVPFTLSVDPDIPSTSELDRYVTYPGYPGADVDQQAVDYITFPGGTLVYQTPTGAAPNNQAIQTNIGLPISSQVIRAVWRRVPTSVFAPGSTLFNRLVGNIATGTLPWIGSINQNAILGYPALTLMLIGASYKYIPDPKGDTYSADIYYTWLYRAQTHLRLYYFDTASPPTKSGFYPISTRVAAYLAPESYVPGTNDFNSMFYVRPHDTGLFTAD